MVAPNDNVVDETSPSSPESVNEGPQLTREEKIKEIDRLMKDGRRAFLLQDFESATESFSVATEYSVSVYGEFAGETFDPHFEYGRALMQMASFEIENAQAQFDGVNEFLAKKLEERKQKLGPAELNESAVGNPDDVPEEERQQVAEAVENALEENAAELEALAEQKATETDQPGEQDTAQETSEEMAVDTEEQKTTESEGVKAEEEKTEEAKVEDTKTEEEKAEDTKTEEEKADDAAEDEEPDEDVDEEPEPTSAELAWNILEVARTTCSKQEPSQEWDLRRADVLHLLSQISSLEEKYNDAIESLTEAVELRKKYLPSHDRVTASYLFEIGETWKQANDFLRAAEYYALAEVALKDRVAELQKENSQENEKDVSEIQGMLKEISDLIADCKESAKSHEQQKAAMAKTETPEKVKPPSDDENMEPAKEIAMVRKKRPATETAEEPVKKAKVESPTPAGDNATEESAAETTA